MNTKMGSTNTAINFQVTRQNKEMIVPAKPTPYELKVLSDLDDQPSLRFDAVCIQVYRNCKNPLMEGKDPVEVIRGAIAKALVFYYPFAGRLRECGPRKLVVDCTAQGVLFAAADADATLHQFPRVLGPPFPNVDQLIYRHAHAPPSADSPLLLFQVTRFKCGGFILALRFNHTMCDAQGLQHFLSAVGELARGAGAPSIAPVWDRHLLSARSPPRVSFTHREYAVAPQYTNNPPNNLVERSFLFDAADISALRRSLPPHARGCTKFELVMSCVWRCRTVAIAPDPDEEVQFSVVVNMRKRLHRPLPEGYYGNVMVYPTAVATAENLTNNSLDYAVELVRKIRLDATEEYMESVMDLMARDMPSLSVAPRCYIVSDHTHSGLWEVDFGWGEAAYGGSAAGGIDPAPGVASFVTAFKNTKGEEGIAVPICLTSNAIDVFTEELHKMIMAATNISLLTASAL